MSGHAIILPPKTVPVKAVYAIMRRYERRIRELYAENLRLKGEQR